MSYHYHCLSGYGSQSILSIYIHSQLASMGSTDIKFSAANMDLFNITQSGFLAIVNLLTILAGMFVLKWASGNGRAKWLLGTFVSYFLFLGVLFLTVASEDPLSMVLYYWQFPLVVLLGYFYCENMYSILADDFSEQRKLFRRVVSTILIPWTAMWGYASLQQLAPDHLLFELALILPFTLILWSFWTLIKQWYWLHRFHPWQFIQYRPKLTSQSKACLGYLMSSFACVVGCILLVMARSKQMPASHFMLYFMLLNSGILFLLVTVFLRYVEQNTKVSAKVTGLTSFITLFCFGFVGLMLFPAKEALPPDHAFNLKKQTLTFLQASDNRLSVSVTNMASFLPATQIVSISSGETALLPLPFGVNFAERTYHFASVSPYGAIKLVEKENANALPDCFAADKPTLSVLCSAQEYKVAFYANEQSVAISWLSNNSLQFQLQLTKAGIIRFVYASPETKQSPDTQQVIGIWQDFHPDGKVSLASDTNVLSSNGGLWIDLSIERKKQANQRYLPLSGLLLLLLLLIHFVLRPYLDRIIQNPLDAILNAMRDVNAGEKEVQIHVDGNIELNQVAHGFNAIIGNLSSAKNTIDNQEKKLKNYAVGTDETISAEVLSVDQRFIKNLNDCIDKYMGDANFNVDTLAAYMFVSTRQLHRRCMTVCNNTPAVLIRQRRLGRAYTLLKAQSGNVSQAANQVGFKDVSYFTKLFSREFGLTPSQLRNQSSE